MHFLADSGFDTYQIALVEHRADCARPDNCQIASWDVSINVYDDLVPWQSIRRGGYG